MVRYGTLGGGERVIYLCICIYVCMCVYIFFFFSLVCGMYVYSIHMTYVFGCLSLIQKVRVIVYE